MKDVTATHTRWANIQHVTGRAAEAVHAGVGLRGRSESRSLEPVRYEGYGPGGAAVLVECVTDDRNRTRTELRRAFTEHGGHLGAEGSVSYLFNHVGLMIYPPGTDEEQLMRAALEAGAEDVVPNSDHSIEVLADPIEFETVRAILTDRGFVPCAAEVTERASLTTPLSGEPAERMVHLLEALEGLNDVRNVYSNVEIPNEVLARI
ncbi:MAG TPA: YebC/PmpR family DNA-binding transcriptional regulator [Steroidobacteraceae bacterium]|nr:YebC/PmpR family DNA-binding transcriptional regulator [Steroidobacteraceae bacterium]